MGYTLAVNRPELLRKNLWLMIRRTPRDRKVWRPLLVIFGALAYLAYDVWAFHYLGVVSTIVMVVSLTAAIGLALLLARSHHRTDESMLHLATRESPAADDCTRHRLRIVETLLGTAALVDRAGMELMHRQGSMNPAYIGVSRQRTLQLVRGCGWEQMSGEAQALLLSPEGSWSEADTWSMIFRVEQVRVLRWVLGVDTILAPLEFADLNVRLALEITTNPKLAAGSVCLSASDLRGAKVIAGHLLDRLIGEGTYRGFYDLPQDDTRRRVLELAQRMREPGAQDQLVGVDTVAEAPEERIRFVLQATLRRVLALGDVLAYLTGPPEAALRMRVAVEQTMQEAVTN